MKNFQSVFKKKFGEFLIPQGYNLRNGIFYKMEDDLFFFIHGKKNKKMASPLIASDYKPRLDFYALNPDIEILIGFFPYCLDMTTPPNSYSYMPKENGEALWKILRKLKPEKTSIEEFSKYYLELTEARDEETAMRNIDRICDEVKVLVLPYLNGLIDLETLYKEYIELIIMPLPDCCYYNPDVEEVYKHNGVIYGLSLKLHKYENALIHVNRWVSVVNDNLEGSKKELAKLRNGDIGEGARQILKKVPNFIELSINSAETSIVNCNNELREWQTIKDALLARDHAYIDNLVKANETKSREHIRKLMEGEN